MDEKIIKDLNSQLEGVHMGASAIRELKEKACSEKIKEELENILKTLRQHEDILTLEIQSHYREATKNEGIWGVIIEFFSGFNNRTLNSDKEIAKSAYKGLEMAFRAINEFLMEIDGLKATLRGELANLSDRYVEHIKNLEKLVESIK